MLRERASEILAGWIVRFERSPLRFRRTTKAATHTAQVASLVDSLTVAATGGTEALIPGSDATRELERSSAFLGGQFASEGATGYDVAALLLELREVVASMVTPDEGKALTQLFEWLTVVAAFEAILATSDDSYRAGRGSSFMRERLQLERDAGDTAVVLDVAR